MAKTFICYTLKAATTNPITKHSFLIIVVDSFFLSFFFCFCFFFGSAKEKVELNRKFKHISWSSGKSIMITPSSSCSAMRLDIQQENKSLENGPKRSTVVSCVGVCKMYPDVLALLQIRLAHCGTRYKT